MLTIKTDEYFNCFPCRYLHNGELVELEYLWTDRDMSEESVSDDEHNKMVEHNNVLYKVDNLLKEIDEEDFEEDLLDFSYMTSVEDAREMYYYLQKCYMNNKKIKKAVELYSMESIMPPMKALAMVGIDVFRANTAMTITSIMESVASAYKRGLSTGRRNYA